MQQLRQILRTMEQAVDSAKQRRTAHDEPVAESRPSAAIAATALPSAAADPAGAAFPIPPQSPHGLGRDIPGPEGLPRAKAKPKSAPPFQGHPHRPFGRTG
jgi:hypothetical protein